MLRAPELLDRAAVEKAVVDSGYIGSDAGFANIYLLRKKYDTLIALQDGFLFRYYNGLGSRRGYAFPLGGGDFRKALDWIVEDAHESERPLEFCLVDEPRAQILREYFEKAVSNRAEPVLHFENNRNDSDYIYSAENLATLPGNQYKKKRNHISRFKRTYGENWEFKAYPENDITADILKVSQKWYEENDGISNDFLRLEHESIEKALQNREFLGLRGGVLYINGEPVAMTLASPISQDVLDVIYERSVGDFEHNGAYAVINQQCARRCQNFLYLNREEDMGVEGLRKAKLSYKPEMILEKFYGEVH